MKKPPLNKWHSHFSFSRDYQRMDRGWKIIVFGILNVHHLPEPGSILMRKRDYKGFLLRIVFFFPIEIE